MFIVAILEWNSIYVSLSLEWMDDKKFWFALSIRSIDVLVSHTYDWLYMKENSSFYMSHVSSRECKSREEIQHDFSINTKESKNVVEDVQHIVFLYGMIFLYFSKNLNIGPAGFLKWPCQLLDDWYVLFESFYIGTISPCFHHI